MQACYNLSLECDNFLDKRSSDSFFNNSFQLENICQMLICRKTLLSKKYKIWRFFLAINKIWTNNEIESEKKQDVINLKIGNFENFSDIKST